jgi:hypothetical protein
MRSATSIGEDGVQPLPAILPVAQLLLVEYDQAQADLRKKSRTHSEFVRRQ